MYYRTPKNHCYVGHSIQQVSDNVPLSREAEIESGRLNDWLDEALKLDHEVV